MEVIFKNRPYENIEINPVEDNQSLEIYVKDNIKGERLVSPFRFNKSNVKILIEKLNLLLEKRNINKFELNNDKFDLSISGPDFGPDELFLFCNHKGPDGKWVESSAMFPEKATPYIIEALKRWAENPNS